MGCYKCAQRALRIVIIVKKISVGFDDETVLCGLVSDVVKYKDGKETEKEKLRSAANIL